MGCGCQGSQWQPAELPGSQAAQQQAKANQPSGPAAAGYFWTGQAQPEPPARKDG